MKTSYSLSIILPAYNEENNIQQVIDASVAYLDAQNIFDQFELIIVNDGSSDGTGRIVEQLKQQTEFIEVVHNEKNLGYGGALVSGIKKARFDWVLLMDADGQFKLESIQSFIGDMASYDIIAGYRQKRIDPIYRVFLGKTYTAIVCGIFALNLKDINCGFKLFKRETLDTKIIHCHAGAFYTDVFISLKSGNFRIKEIPVQHYSRLQGKQTGASLKVVFTAITDVFRLLFSSR